MTSNTPAKPRYIPRRLSYIDSEGNRLTVDEDWLLERTEPLVSRQRR